MCRMAEPAEYDRPITEEMLQLLEEISTAPNSPIRIDRSDVISTADYPPPEGEALTRYFLVYPEDPVPQHELFDNHYFTPYDYTRTDEAELIYCLKTFLQHNKFLLKVTHHPEGATAIEAHNSHEMVHGAVHGTREVLAWLQLTKDLLFET